MWNILNGCYWEGWQLKYRDILIWPPSSLWTVLPAFAYFLPCHVICTPQANYVTWDFPKFSSFCECSSFHLEFSLSQGFSTWAGLTVRAGSFLLVVGSLLCFSSLYPNNYFHFHTGIDNISLSYLFSNLFQLHFQLSSNLKPIKL